MSFIKERSKHWFTKALRRQLAQVVINDASEQKWLEALYPEKMFFWIGLRVSGKEATWQWSNGEPLTYANWIVSQEPDIGSTDEGELPVAMEFFSKRWMAIGAESPFLPMVKYAILEKEWTPEATQ